MNKNVLLLLLKLQDQQVLQQANLGKPRNEMIKEEV
jgi:hypothetical protein